jgi:ABC-type multidrug transport system ATPase subunit
VLFPRRADVGLDLVNAELVRDIIRTERDRSLTVFVTTHEW